MTEVLPFWKLLHFPQLTGNIYSSESRDQQNSPPGANITEYHRPNITVLTRKIAWVYLTDYELISLPLHIPAIKSEISHIHKCKIIRVKDKAHE